MKRTVLGSVLIFGGGISGVQCALDLADSGYKVYLVEKKPSIGGVMAQKQEDLTERPQQPSNVVLFDEKKQ